MARNPRQKAYHLKVRTTKILLKNSDDKSFDSKELQKINLTPKILTEESLKAKSPATIFSQRQGKTANSLVIKSLKMKYPTAKSLKMKTSVVKNLLTKYSTKKRYKGKISLKNSSNDN